jgi:hypothetical protein
VELSTRPAPMRYNKNRMNGRNVTFTFDVDFGLGHPVPEGYIYGDLALQVRGVSDETVKSGYGFCATRTIE